MKTPLEFIKVIELEEATADDPTSITAQTVYLVTGKYKSPVASVLTIDGTLLYVSLNDCADATAEERRTFTDACPWLPAKARVVRFKSHTLGVVTIVGEESVITVIDATAQPNMFWDDKKTFNFAPVSEPEKKKFLKHLHKNLRMVAEAYPSME